MKKTVNLLPSLQSDSLSQSLVDRSFLSSSVLVVFNV